MSINIKDRRRIASVVERKWEENDMPLGDWLFGGTSECFVVVNTKKVEMAKREVMRFYVKTPKGRGFVFYTA